MYKNEAFVSGSVDPKALNKHQTLISPPPQVKLISEASSVKPKSLGQGIGKRFFLLCYAVFFYIDRKSENDMIDQSYDLSDICPFRYALQTTLYYGTDKPTYICTVD